MWTRWLLRAGPSDYVLAMSVASASLPVIGKHLEPLGAATAMGIWGYRHMPEFFSATARSWLSPGNTELRKRERDMTHAVSEAALRGVVPAEISPSTGRRRNVPRRCGSAGAPAQRAPDLGSLRKPPSQLLDVWRREDLPRQPAPVLIFVPGGAWVHGSRLLQGYALMSHLAEMGWVCLSIDYRVAPHHRWPQHITDVKTAIAWARANVDKFGGDRNFVAIGGFGRRTSVGTGRPDHQRPGDAERPAGGFGHLGGRRRRHLRPLRLGGPVHRGTRAVRRLPRAGRGRAQDIPAPGYLPQGVTDRPGASRRPAVPGHPRLGRLRHPGCAGPRLRRAAACRVALGGELHGAARRGPCVRHDRRSPHRFDGDRNRPVPQPDSPKPDPDQGQRGYRRLRREV